MFSKKVEQVVKTQGDDNEVLKKRKLKVKTNNHIYVNNGLVMKESIKVAKKLFASPAVNSKELLDLVIMPTVSQMSVFVDKADLYSEAYRNFMLNNWVKAAVPVGESLAASIPQWPTWAHQDKLEKVKMQELVVAVKVPVVKGLIRELHAKISYADKAAEKYGIKNIKAIPGVKAAYTTCEEQEKFGKQTLALVSYQKYVDDKTATAVHFEAVRAGVVKAKIDDTMPKKVWEDIKLRASPATPTPTPQGPGQLAPPATTAAGP
jgi:hypothetical protein